LAPKTKTETYSRAILAVVLLVTDATRVIDQVLSPPDPSSWLEVVVRTEPVGHGTVVVLVDAAVVVGVSEVATRGVLAC